MPSALSSVFNCLNCFGRKPIVTEPVTIPVSENSSEKHAKLSIYSATSSEPLQEGVSETSSPTPLVPTRLNRSLAVIDKRQYAILESPFPTLSHEKEVIIRTMAVGLNPIDWKSVDYNFCMPGFPWVNGREMAGIVEHVGSEVDHVQIGQRVWTSTYYRDSRAGCFQEFVVVPGHTVTPIPTDMTFEQAACLGVAGLTSAMTLWKWLQVPGSPKIETRTIPDSGYLLIWGGSTITAQFAIQIAVLGGLRVIAVTSEKTKPLAEKLGAEFVVTRDGKTGDEIVEEIRAIGGDDITRCIDLVGTTTANHCLQALSVAKESLFAPLAMISKDASVPANVKVETVEMKKFVLEPESEVYSMALSRLVEDGRVTLPEIEVVKGGLDAIQEGLERVKRGDMAGKKMVVSIG